MSDQGGFSLGLGPDLTQIFPDQWTRPFWDAARDGRLVACRCGSCGTFRMPPTALCWSCHSRSIEWVDLPGTGSIYTYTVAHHPLTPSAAAAVPYVIVVVALDGAPGTRLISNVVGADPGEVVIGQPVEVVFDHGADVSVPRFRRVSEPSDAGGF